MKEVVKFIIENKTLIAEILLAIFSLVLFLVKKKPIKMVDTIGEEVIAICIGAIIGVEKPGYTGAQKKEAVIECVKDWLIKNHPEIDFQIYLDFASKMIEKILSTPQKKEEKR